MFLIAGSSSLGNVMLVAGDRPWAGLRHAQIVAAKIRGHPAGELQWPPGSNKAIKVTDLS